MNLYGYVGNSPGNGVDVWGLDPGGYYPSSDAAAIQAIQDTMNTSLSASSEYGGNIYTLANGGYSYTMATTSNSPKHVEINVAAIPPGTTYAGSYHTHPVGYYKGELLHTEQFSPDDIKFAQDFHKPVWVGTLGGRILKYIPLSPFKIPLGQKCGSNTLSAHSYWA